MVNFGAMLRPLSLLTGAATFAIRKYVRLYYIIRTCALYYTYILFAIKVWISRYRRRRRPPPFMYTSWPTKPVILHRNGKCRCAPRSHTKNRSQNDPSHYPFEGNKNTNVKMSAGVICNCFKKYIRYIFIFLSIQ